MLTLPAPVQVTRPLHTLRASCKCIARGRADLPIDKSARTGLSDPLLVCTCINYNTQHRQPYRRPQHRSVLCRCAETQQVNSCVATCGLIGTQQTPCADTAWSAIQGMVVSYTNIYMCKSHLLLSFTVKTCVYFSGAAAKSAQGPVSLCHKAELANRRDPRSLIQPWWRH